MRFESFTEAVHYSQTELLDQGVDVDVGRWQGYPTTGKPDLVTKEILDLRLEVPVCRGSGNWEDNLQTLRVEIQPNLPWADDHFEERVSRVPSNPGEEYKNWPWWRGQVEVTGAHPDTGEQIIGNMTAHGRGIPRDFVFTHTYQERFWPKQAGHPEDIDYSATTYGKMFTHKGIRYNYGDLDDVVRLLVKEPYGRQAYFPILFPEDTGAVHGGRIPCTLGYHFLLRDYKLHCWYDIRSCDLVRHFRDDLYMACRLMLWVISECRNGEEMMNLRHNTGDVATHLWDSVVPGDLFFCAHSFHVHYGDLHHVRH